jgi:hypothetical protein
MGDAGSREVGFLVGFFVRGGRARHCCVLLYDCLVFEYEEDFELLIIELLMLIKRGLNR